MDINDLRSAATVACFIALIGVFIWAYSPKRKARFEQDGQLPFVEDKDEQPLTKKRQGAVNE